MDELSFEDAYARLDGIVRTLEAEDLPIERAVDLFEQAMALVRVCGARLDEAELRVSQLAVGPRGEIAIVDVQITGGLGTADNVDSGR